jgi:hypothetical protein
MQTLETERHGCALDAAGSSGWSDSDFGSAPDNSSTESRPAGANRNESADGYDRVVAVLNHKWRVIECRDGIQWILQFRDRLQARATGTWQGRSYCRTSQALIRYTREHAGAVDPAAMAILAALPEWIGHGRKSALISPATKHPF